ncbi:PH domain-containing protein [Melghirimyces algeriensis]|uniref:Short C-terminal domain-containing protein n=1 Tax=Melghirimyces algeriensis TaxID=910412 RepID=A0A521FFR9_9BACL|nr:PH domain-containing protein [Melghirimyces algeriensis]SMO94511.1 Short C-terminal domain-containing protein [Melghirimyces algeriensis]
MAKIDKLLKKAREHLEPSEEMLSSVMGAYETKSLGQKTVRNGVFIATNHRVVFYGKRLSGYDLEVFPYSNISSIEMGKSMMGHYISFFASGNKVKMKWINHGDVEGFISLVRNRIGKKSESEKNVLTSEADELKKYAELRDQGIITEEEFAKKKKQILG